MLKSFKGRGSLQIGQGEPAPCGARIIPPVHSMPDRVNPDQQRNRNQELKAGISGPSRSHNPGRKQ
jgi:hypothetical protein